MDVVRSAERVLLVLLLRIRCLRVIMPSQLRPLCALLVPLEALVVVIEELWFADHPLVQQDLAEVLYAEQGGTPIAQWARVDATQAGPGHAPFARRPYGWTLGGRASPPLCRFPFQQSWVGARWEHSHVTVTTYTGMVMVMVLNSACTGPLPRYL